jgi:hypothetical protein
MFVGGNDVAACTQFHCRGSRMSVCRLTVCGSGDRRRFSNRQKIYSLDTDLHEALTLLYILQGRIRTDARRVVSIQNNQSTGQFSKNLFPMSFLYHAPSK